MASFNRSNALNPRAATKESAQHSSVAPRVPLKPFAVVLAMLACAACAPFAKADTCSSSANLIANCGFENGSTAGTNNVPTSWNVAQWTSEEQIVGYYQNSGNYALRIANDAGQGGPLYNGAAVLSQTFTDHPGDTLQFSFYLANDAQGGGTELFQAFYDSTSTPLFSSNGSSVGLAETMDTFSVTATGSDTIMFTSYNNPGWFYLDDVSVVDKGASKPIGTAVTPEPSSLALLGTGLTGLAGMLRRRFRTAG